MQTVSGGNVTENIMLTIVAIGRNEGPNIDRLGESVKRLRRVVDFNVDAVFVDSASKDDSVARAKAYFDSVIELADGPLLCAAAGRAVGTAAAQGEWVLYLDGDMELDDEFIGRIPTLVQTEDKSIAGFVGDYLHIFPDGHTVRKSYGADKFGVVVGFGGASLLRRSVVVSAGNWDASVFAHEELDLFARIRWGGNVIRTVDSLMISHWSDYPSRTRRIVRIFVPSGGLGKLYYGIGQLVASRMRHATRGLDVLAVEPYLAVLGVGALLALIVAAWSIPVSMAIVLLSGAIVIWARGSTALLVYISWYVQVPFGYSKYVPKYQPGIKDVWCRSRVSDEG